MLRQQASLRAGARGQPRSGRSSTTAVARREQMSHGLMLQHGKCSVQKAPMFVMAWEQQGFQEKHTAATAKGYGCPQAPPEHCHDTAVPGRGQGGTLLPSSCPAAWIGTAGTHTTLGGYFCHRPRQWMQMHFSFTCKQKEKGFAGSLTRQNLLEEHGF